jgi:hypothetical protein
VLVVVAALSATTSCGEECSGVAIDHASDTVGFPTARTAVDDFAGHQGLFGLPRSGWRRDGSDQSGVVFRSGDALLHVVQGSDGTWQVGDGRSC